METTTQPDTVRAPKVGDILESSWGYDETHRDFYQVVGVTPSSVRLRKLATRVVNVEWEVSDDSYTTKVTASAGDFEPESNARSFEKPYCTEKGALRKFVLSPKGYSCRVSDHAWAGLWDGAPAYQSTGTH